MIKIAAITDHINTPSSRFRIRSHISGLKKNRIYVQDFERTYSSELAGLIYPDKRIRHSPFKASSALKYEIGNVAHTFLRVIKTQKFDATWISRELMNGYPSFEFMLKKPIYYDIDDAVYLNKISRVGINRILKRSTAVFAGNEYLASYCRQFSNNVLVVPTAVDVQKFRPPAIKRKSNRFNVGWSGTSSSFKFFLPIQRELSRFFRSHRDARLKIFSDRFPGELNELLEYIEFEFWSEAREAEQLQSLDVGLMPIDDSEWSRGKCAYKLLLYAATEVPTVCSPIGMNADVLRKGRVGLGSENPKQWREYLEHMYANRDCLNEIYRDCRKVVVDNYSIDIVQSILVQEFLRKSMFMG